MDLIRQLGRFPDSKRKSAFLQLSNYKNGQFQNLLPTPALAEGASMVRIFWKFFQKMPDTVPAYALPFVDTDLRGLKPEENVLVWFGHSSYFLQLEGKRFLVDPVFSGYASPFRNSVRAFPGTNHYQAAAMPDIDVLFISHDHWDHLDYRTVQQLRPKVKKVICGLGVARHFEYWGWSREKLVEKNWYDQVDLGEGCTVTLTPARHFSGRLFSRNISLWTSFVLQTPALKIFLGGDSGYGSHFKEIGALLGPFDLAILECGQYNQQWPYIHSLPREILPEALELKAQRVLPVHHSKFKLAQHPWYEPLQQVTALAETGKFPLLTPKIGEKVDLDQLDKPWERWWEPGVKNGSQNRKQ
ncbi:L-ascorbate metabolism protein UlaG, beta-lactamase superfamily [Niabella drilacis]|uniref:L-ascorbate metabolism protein UlaG, beta-lactamase superfamily n=2 Tax=Niabella drilacis (strain DSM 25811 / CCM 8410 / CCUG 62505 / LMG 26954 / E90) TaxID=1285928 RepID=A0A1G6ZT68_NIADE|nr:L-ascorbate metabolism protein UlaG, beta-lactamase superfamily [Niabella drilacis]